MLLGWHPLQELPPNSQPPGDESDRLLLDQLKAAAPGTELAVDEDEPPAAAAQPAEAAAVAAAVPVHEAGAAAGNEAAELLAVGDAAAGADEPMPGGEAAGMRPAAPSVMTLSDQTLIDKAASPTKATGTTDRYLQQYLQYYSTAGTSQLRILATATTVHDRCLGAVICGATEQAIHCSTYLHLCFQQYLQASIPALLTSTCTANGDCRQAQQKGLFQQGQAGMPASGCRATSAQRSCSSVC